MSTNSEREALKRAFRGKKWHDRVNAMPDGQVIAVFKRLRRQRII